MSHRPSLVYCQTLRSVTLQSAADDTNNKMIRSQRMAMRSRMMKDTEKYSQASHLPIAHGLLIWHLAAERGEGFCSLSTDADIGVPSWHCALLTPINTENKTSDEKFWQHELEIDCVPLRFTSGARWWRAHCKYPWLTLCGPVLLFCTFSLLR